MDAGLRAEAALDAASHLAGPLLGSAGLDRDDVLAVAAGVPGPLDRQRRAVTSPILSSWTGFAAAGELAGCLGKPVDVENDADMGAIGEKWSGAAREYANFFCMKVLQAVGAGVVIDSQCYRRGVTGQIGHTQLPGALTRCRCGNRGCLDAVVSVPAVCAQLAGTHLRADQRGAEPSLAKVARDPAGARVLAGAGRTAGRVAADGCHWLDPEAIILGGELGISGPPFAEGFRESLGYYAQPAPADVVAVDIAGLGSRSEVMGAIAVATDR